MALKKVINVWVLSIEDCGEDAQTWVFMTNNEALDKLRAWFKELAVIAYGVQRDFDEVALLSNPADINDPGRAVDHACEAYANALATVEQIMPPPDTEVIGEVLWDDRIVWLERHRLELAARPHYAPEQTWV